MKSDDLKDRLRAATEQAANEFEAVADEIADRFEHLCRLHADLVARHSVATSQLANCQEEIARLEAELGKFGPIVPSAVFDMKLYDLELSVREYNCLNEWFGDLSKATVRDLVALSPAELMRTPNFGKVSLKGIEQVLAGLHPDLKLRR